MKAPGGGPAHAAPHGRGVKGGREGAAARRARPRAKEGRAPPAPPA